MSRATRWTVEILIDEADGGTHAVARLDTSDDAHVHGHGSCRASPAPPAPGSTPTRTPATGPSPGAPGPWPRRSPSPAALREVATKLSVRAHVEGGGGELTAAHPRGA